MGTNQNKDLSLFTSKDATGITTEGRQHLEKFFINIFHGKLANQVFDTSKSFLEKQDSEKHVVNFIGLVTDCCLTENVNPLIIKNKGVAISLIREHCGIIELKSFLSSIAPASKLQEVLRLSGTEKDINLLWTRPEINTALDQTPKKLEALKREVLDIFYWIRIVKELCESGNKRLLAKFTTVREVERFKFETAFRKDRIFTTLIVSAILGEIKNEFNFADIKRFEEIVVQNPEWEKGVGKSFEKLFVGSNFASIPFVEIPYVQNMITNIKKSFVPLTIGKRLIVDDGTKNKIIALNNLKSVHFQTFVHSYDDPKSIIPGSDSFNSVATISKLVENENCLIFEEIFFIEPQLLMFLNKVQLKRLVFANRLHGMFDDDGLRKVFDAAGLLNVYEESVLFADKALAPHVFSKILAEPENISILKDVLNYQKDKTFREMSKKVAISKGGKFAEIKKIILKLISLSGKKTRMNPKAYARFLLSLANNSKNVVDKNIMTALFMVYPEDRLPAYIIEFAKKQAWYDVFDENARKHFTL